MIYFHSYKNPGLVLDIVEGLYSCLSSMKRANRRTFYYTKYLTSLASISTYMDQNQAQIFSTFEFEVPPFWGFCPF